MLKDEDLSATSTPPARPPAAAAPCWRSGGESSGQEKARFDLVTDADVASQRAVHSYLQGRFPDHGFLGEEGSGRGAARARRAADLDRGPTRWHHQLRPRFPPLLRLHRPASRRRTGRRGGAGPVAERNVSRGEGSGAWVGARRLHTSRAARRTRRCWPPASRPTCAARNGSWIGGVTFRCTPGAAPHRLDGDQPGVGGGRPFRRLLGLRQPRLGRGRRRGAGAGGRRRAHGDGRRPLDPFSNKALASNGPLHPGHLEALRLGRNKRWRAGGVGPGDGTAVHRATGG